MNATWNNEKIKVFVKNNLGCGCPEKVFEKIDVIQHMAVGHNNEVTRIVVGDTLLVYVIRADLSADSVESIALAGKIDRDKNSYNRFRLVVSGHGYDEPQAKASEKFSELFDNDEKMHIHFVTQKSVDGLI